ncbi:major facilitator superfamily domain-containing protein [Phascolomyces articulosus]|uniref:Major facilitator superfamily domain-containing protein n=1 Tax=Phascolomyces articulosus TaxID=60185 RepID=A0AAD5K819_9FUNG|nr:major facilitator superfamily domain-containing protein [Phascolomyces articulosus]
MYSPSNASGSSGSGSRRRRSSSSDGYGTETAMTTPLVTNTTSYGAINNKQSETLDTTANDPIIEKQLVRKLDKRMLIWAFLACFAKKLDRNNLQNAFTMGMDIDLGLNSSVYNWSLTMFFIGYIVLQIPGNIIITKFKPRLVLPTFVIIWGTVVCFMAFVRDYKELWMLRFCLGLAEAPFYPGMVFLFGSWYKKSELGKRIAFFSTGNEISAAAGGLIAGTIYDRMHGAAGLPGWKWLFIIEGLIAVALGIIGYILLPNLPHDNNTGWLTKQERENAILRTQQQSKQVTLDSYNWSTVKSVFATPYSWLLMVNSSCLIFCTYLQLNFAIVLRDTGFPVSFSNYMQTPLFIFAAISAVCIGWSSDKKDDRAFHIAGLQTWVGVWYLLLFLFTTKITVTYRSDPIIVLFLVIIGTYAIAVASSLPALCLTWTNEIYKDQYTRAVAIAFINAISNLAPSLLGIKAWLVTDSPEFWLGKLSGVCAAFASVIITLSIWFMLRIDFMAPKTNSADDGDNDDQQDDIQR